MACEIATFGRVMFVLWGTPERRDFELLTEKARAMHDAHGAFVFIGRVPAGAAPPADSVRKDVSNCMSFILDWCASFHALMEGAGFSNSAKRAVLATIFLMTRHRAKLHIHASKKDVVPAAPPDVRAEIASALEKFEARGLLSRNLDSIAPPRRQSTGLPMSP